MSDFYTAATTEAWTTASCTGQIDVPKEENTWPVDTKRLLTDHLRRAICYIDLARGAGDEAEHDLLLEAANVAASLTLTSIPRKMEYKLDQDPAGNKEKQEDEWQKLLDTLPLHLDREYEPSYFPPSDFLTRIISRKTNRKGPHVPAKKTKKRPAKRHAQKAAAKTKKVPSVRARKTQL